MSNEDIIPKIIQNRIAIGGAMIQRSEHYPTKYNGKVPLKVKMLETVTTDLPLIVLQMQDNENIPMAISGNEYYVNVNSHGAVSAIFEDGQLLGLKSNEFEVVEFHQ